MECPALYHQSFKQKRPQIINQCVSSTSGKLFYQRTSTAANSRINRFLTAPKSLFVVSHKISTNVDPLRKLCMDYVVENFHLVDSLDGFPELIGKELFDMCVDFGYFQPDKDGNWMEIMQIFISTYGHALLQSLFLSGKWLFLSSHVDNFTPYRYISFADFSRCKIGDDHQALDYLGSLQWLSKLYLHNNSLSTEGVKLLTQSFRRKHTGLETLCVLRLDGNPQITIESFIYLNSLPSLELVVVSESPKICYENIPVGSNELGLFSKCPHSIRFHQRDWESTGPDNLGEGWAIPLIASYITEMENALQKRQSKLNTGQSKSNFYSKPKTIHKIPNKDFLCKNHIILCKCRKHQKPSSNTSQKRSIEAVEESVQPKRKCLHNLKKQKDSNTKLKLDKDILDMYL